MIKLKHVGYWLEAGSIDTDAWYIVKTLALWASIDLTPLPRAQDCVDATWDPFERGLVIGYLGTGRLHGAEYGESMCRICNQRNGCREYTDDTYIWPEGLHHYLVKHDVKPPQEFIDHVRKMRL